jgi:hypothetical protein
MQSVFEFLLEKYDGVDPRGAYVCPVCGGVMYCVEETASGDALYQCQNQECNEISKVIFQ